VTSEKRPVHSLDFIVARCDGVRRPARQVEVDFAIGECVSYRRDALLREPFEEAFTGDVFSEDADIAAARSRG
jgi:hypothetical protein